MRKHQGRKAINIFKDAYRRGVTDFGRGSAQELLVSHGYKAGKLKRPTLNAWLRQAALEVATEDKLSVTNRVSVNEYKSSSVAPPVDRGDARQQRRKDTATRIRNDLTEAIADATRDDVTLVELVAVHGYEQALADVEFVLAQYE